MSNTMTVYYSTMGSTFDSWDEAVAAVLAAHPAARIDDDGADVVCCWLLAARIDLVATIRRVESR